MGRALRILGLVVAVFVSPILSVAQAPESYLFEVRYKSWVEIPEKYQMNAPAWQTRIGYQWSPSRKTHSILYLGRVGRTGWQYHLKGARGNEFTIYGGENWRWNPGDGIIITGSTDASGVFIPQGERCYAVR